MLDILKIALTLVLILFGSLVSHWIIEDVGYADLLGLWNDSFVGSD